LIGPGLEFSLQLSFIDETTFQVFQEVSPPNAGCMIQMENGLNGEYLYFDIQNSQVVGLSIPGFSYGTYFEKN
jgi:hypothetical protein